MEDQLKKNNGFVLENDENIAYDRSSTHQDESSSKTGVAEIE